jgi:hypothetical protein
MNAHSNAPERATSFAPSASYTLGITTQPGRSSERRNRDAGVSGDGAELDASARNAPDLDARETPRRRATVREASRGATARVGAADHVMTARRERSDDDALAGVSDIRQG